MMWHEKGMHSVHALMEQMQLCPGKKTGRKRLYLENEDLELDIRKLVPL